MKKWNKLPEEGPLIHFESEREEEGPFIFARMKKDVKIMKF